MKTKVLLIVLTLFAIGTSVRAQSPEEMQKMMDSLMGNIPDDQKAFIQQMMKKGQEADNRRQVQKEQAQKEQRAKNQAARKEAEMEFYWRNKIATNTSGKFENWSFGKCDIKVRFSKGYNMPVDFLKVGVILADGQVRIELPNVDYKKWQTRPITKPAGEGDQMLFNTDHLAFSNENVQYFSTRFTLEVHSGEEYLGSLNLGNSVKPVTNLNAPCCFDKAGDGYAAFWVYMSQPNTITGTKEFTTKGTTDLGKTINDSGKIVHDLNFKAGWNLVLALVEGAIHKPSSGIPDPIFWQNQYYTVSETTPIDLKYYFTSNL